MTRLTVESFRQQLQDSLMMTLRINTKTSKETFKYVACYGQKEVFGGHTLQEMVGLIAEYHANYSPSDKPVSEESVTVSVSEAAEENADDSREYEEWAEEFYSSQCEGGFCSVGSLPVFPEDIVMEPAVTSLRAFISACNAIALAFDCPKISATSFRDMLRDLSSKTNKKVGYKGFAKR